MERPRKLSRVGKSYSVSRMPIVELTGQKRLLIENHLGVLGYSLEEICVKVDFGCICVKGSDLRILQLSKEQVVICGYVDTIQMFGGGL